MGPDAMFLVFWMLSFKPTFSLSSFTFIKRFFSSSSLSAIRVVSSVYLRLLMFLLAILIPACAFFSPAFLMMYSAYKLNKQGDNIQPWCTPFPLWNQSVVPCPVLTVSSWPAYRFLKRQVRWSGTPISFRIFHSLLWSTQSKIICKVNKDKASWKQISLETIWHKARSEWLKPWHLCQLLFTSVTNWPPSKWQFKNCQILLLKIGSYCHLKEDIFPIPLLTGS